MDSYATGSYGTGLLQKVDYLQVVAQWHHQGVGARHRVFVVVKLSQKSYSPSPRLSVWFPHKNRKNTFAAKKFAAVNLLTGMLVFFFGGGTQGPLFCEFHNFHLGFIFILVVYRSLLFLP